VSHSAKALRSSRLASDLPRFSLPSPLDNLIPTKFQRIHAQT